jgi:hypothetical protein
MTPVGSITVSIQTQTPCSLCAPIWPESKDFKMAEKEKNRLEGAASSSLSIDSNGSSSTRP